MSDELTIYEAAKRAEDGCPCFPCMLEALGLDPDMTVTELQRRLKIAERVLQAQTHFVGVEDVSLAWLTREEGHQ